MQTILGSNGQIGTEVAKELYKNYTQDIRLVGRKPKQINPTDELVKADLFKYEDAYRAIKGSDVVYFTVGLPYNLWDSQFPTILDNVIRAVHETGAKLAYFDNTYMYAKDDKVQVDDSPFEPVGHKSTLRGEMTETLLKAMNDGYIDAVIGRAPEFYGPDHTQSITNTMVFNRVKEGKRAVVPLSDSVLRTLIWTPDASRALALLGNTPEAYGQTWHLPTAPSLSYKDIIAKTGKIIGQDIKYSVVPMWAFKLASYFNDNAKELLELLPRYKYDNVFKSDKFQKQFPNFKITSFDEGIRQIFGK
ncbi:nucleoside-diphosphate-sugar epimerase [Weissella uvarum]|uniref:NAD-dependent epimerase/dehydratase family protein n=1 Tax=Weissella uvarum TaxID=1479233 RepID=UPI00195FC1E8|nr:NAD-dependent epimerase/dehydratase family protein [Weissella uvarum]MBM7617426.1 nucleoside-diphosphate-sugar epimerase [Weissella uvarum]MCM0595689.1 NAD-dependent epimerase/dehydratase family protein [Weissella uvarum]